MKLSVSAYRAHASAHKKILTSSYQQHYGSTAAPPICNPLQPPNFTPQLFDEEFDSPLKATDLSRVLQNAAHKIYSLWSSLKLVKFFVKGLKNINAVET
ncbi:hypothetical protein SFRURICE_021017 [Spodoptera frugiperda]|nr:hypothetical protein SFRURICE_021017 [Spodoptera frugiperda]